jgi:hypothetical protein
MEIIKKRGKKNSFFLKGLLKLVHGDDTQWTFDEW